MTVNTATCNTTNKREYYILVFYNFFRMHAPIIFKYIKVLIITYYADMETN